MSTVTLRPSSAREVLLALQAQVATITGLDLTRVIITAAEPADVPHHAAEQDILLRLGAEYSELSVEGGGRFADLRRREVQVYCRSRLWLDTTDSDTARLTDASLGHVALEDRLLEAVQRWMPLEPADDPGAAVNAIALPGEAGGFSAPVRDRQDPSWVSSRLELSFQYQRAYTEKNI